MEEKGFPKGIQYKIDSEHFYTIMANVWNGKTFYNVKIFQTNIDNTKTEFKRQLRFIKCEPPKNGDNIRIISGFESVYVNNKDPYNPISCICVTEWELQETVEEKKQEAYNQFQNSVSDEDIVITDDDMPF